MPVSNAIFQREMLVAGRARLGGTALVYAVGSIALLSAGVMAWQSYETYTVDQRVGMIARITFIAALFYQWSAIVAIAQNASAHTIAADRETGAFDLLVLAEPSVRHIVWAKYCAGLWQTAVYVLAFVPFYAFAAAISEETFILEPAAFVLAAAIAAPACAIFGSSAGRGMNAATGIAFVVFVLWLAAVILGFYYARTGLLQRPMLGIFDIVQPASGLYGVVVLFVASLVSAAALVEISAAFLQRSIRSPRVAFDVKRRMVRRDGGPDRSVPRLIRVGAWGNGGWPREFVLFGAGVCMGVFPIVGWMFIPCALSALVTQGLARLRTSGLWGDLMLLPEDDADLAAAIQRASWRQAAPLTAGSIVGCVIGIAYFNVWAMLILPVIILFIVCGIPLGLVGAIQHATPKDQERRAVWSVMRLCFNYGAMIPGIALWVIVRLLPWDLTPMRIVFGVFVLTILWYVPITMYERRNASRGFLKHFRYSTCPYSP